MGTGRGSESGDGVRSRFLAPAGVFQAFAGSALTRNDSSDAAVPSIHPVPGVRRARLAAHGVRRFRRFGLGELVLSAHGN